MRVLAIGDFHGKFPMKFEKIIKYKKIDLVVSVGDYPPFHYRKLWFKHCFGKDIGLEEIIGVREYKKLVMEDYRRAEVALKKLDKLHIPVITVLGNIDWPMPDDVSDFNSSNSKSNKNNMPNWDRKDLLAERMKKYKNIKRFDYKGIRFGEFVFIGMRGHSFQGNPKSKAFRKHKKKLDKLFKKYNKENKEGKVIFVSHNVPYNTRLDKISLNAHEFVRGKHGGSKMAKRIVDQKEPILAIGGHIHEGIGKQKIGKTLVINCGSALEGKAAIIDIPLDKGGKVIKSKIKVKFIK